MRLNKAIAHAGYCSRRSADNLIKQGAVCVNGIVVDNCATQVSSVDVVTVNGQKLEHQEKVRLWCFYKPVGLVTTHFDPQGRPTVFDFIKSKMPDISHLVSIGRLDINSEGLLLLTNNGDLAKQMMHPSSGLARIYRVRVYGEVSVDQLRKLTKPFVIEGMRYKPFEFLSPLNSLKRGNHWLELRLYEGKYREIRKAMNSIGLQVNRLLRTDYGSFSLGKHKPGDIWEVKYVD